MAARLRLLVVEDSEADFLLHERNLQKHGLVADLHRVDALPGLEEALKDGDWDAVISDYSLPGLDFHRVLALLKERLPAVPVILVSGSIGEEAAVGLLREGVWDFVWKDRPARLAQALIHCLEQARTRNAKQKAEVDLRETMFRLQMAVAAGGYGVWDSHLAERQLIWDGRLCAIYGLAPAEAPADLEGWLERVLPEDRTQVRASVEAALQGPGELDLAFRIRRQDGAIRHLHSLGIVMRDAAGAPIRIFGLSEDVTAQVLAEEERRTMEAQIRHTEKLESLGSLASGVAHDMNNVLAAILAVGQVLRLKLEEDPGVAAALDTIIKAANRGRDLVRGLTNFARKDLRAAQSLDLNRLVADEAALLERTLRQKIRLEVDLATSLPPFKGEPGNFGSALMNLCVNAVDAMPEGGTLTLRTRALEDGWMELVVADTGRGMPPEVLSRALEPFFTTKEVGQGTGLGLAMVHGTVKAHGGLLDIRSKVGEGTTISIRLPACVEDLLEAGAHDEAAAPKRKSQKVLVVDDDELIQATVPLLLQHLGHRPTSAACGEAALDLLAHGLEPDAVILDLNMPGLGGEGTYRRLRELYPRLPVLVATGFMDPSTDLLLQADPLARSLSKPFSIDELDRKLTALEGATGPGGHPPRP